MSKKQLLILPGDGVGPEIFDALEPIFGWLQECEQLDLEIDHDIAGYCAYVAEGATISADTLARAAASDAVLFGSESTEEYAHLPREQRPASGLLQLRVHLGGFANLRPIAAHPELIDSSPLKAEIVHGVDLMIVRELLGGLYFGKPSGIEPADAQGRRRAVDSLVYTSDEIERVAHVAFETARGRRGRLCSVDKANVLATGVLWRDVVSSVAHSYPDVELTHMYVDNCAMQLVRRPGQFDVIVTENTFGDILSDCAAMITGSIGMLPSASLGEAIGSGVRRGLYEPIHGSAPDIAGKGIANPIGTILSLAMALRYSLDAVPQAVILEAAVASAISKGARTGDLGGSLETRSMVSAILEHLSA